ncbi:nitroreductase [Alkaliphilus metalliredigens QYMF]|uniref:Nitroreductase n=1 Tax=Alkaliphilus metalliredigens (strain QYMF) TaxID=293826 RepID=A6TWZ2_ALKMQ|nr:nitroreductase family protein [Alkaliphilus metalliredigens]ABR50710.1 nitroreductase [Alkaliphilus metalliredigens QYMF]
MDFYQLIQRRKSVRVYGKKPVDIERLNDLMDEAEEIKGIISQIDTQFVLIENGWEQEEKLQGKIGYDGNVVRAPHYIVLLCAPKEGYLQNAGYMMEQMVLKTIEYELSTCWLTINHGGHEVKDLLGIQEAGIPVAMIALGYGQEGDVEAGKKEDNDKLSLQDFVYDQRWGRAPWLEEIKMRGLATVFSHIGNAPSFRNRQPWKLIIDGDEIILTVGHKTQEDGYLLIDAGIMMIYMERSFNEEGLMAKWSLYMEALDGIYEAYGIPEYQKIIGTLHI